MNFETIIEQILEEYADIADGGRTGAVSVSLDINQWLEVCEALGLDTQQFEVDLEELEADFEEELPEDFSDDEDEPEEDF